jgi:RHS repeat-associated protein
MQLSPSRPSKCRNAGFQIIRHCPRISRPRTHLRTDGQNITGIVDNVTAANSATFAAGNAGRLQNADGPWGSKTFYYDGVGNRSTEISTVGGVSTTDNYGYPANNNRLVQITRGAATVAAMTYDAGGNLLTDNRVSGNKTYTYNKRNRLATAVVGALSYAYTYNGREQLSVRQKTTAPVATTHFVHDIFGNVLAETSGVAAGTTREYIWLPETEIAPTREAMSQVDRPLAVVNGVGTAGIAVWNVSVDHLNRPVLMTNATKVAMWTAVWQPWGGAHSITGTATLDTRFPGQWYQSETGLHYNWHRSYDPTVGRYTQPDPLGFVDGPSVYGYAKGRPQSLVDLNGLMTSTPRPTIPSGITYCAKDCSKDVYHRRLDNDPKQIDEAVNTGMVCGRGARQAGGGASPFPCVKAYAGPLPPNTKGIEFTTKNCPTSFNPFLKEANWCSGPFGSSPMPGMTVREGGDLVCIPVELKKATK